MTARRDGPQLQGLPGGAPLVGQPQSMAVVIDTPQGRIQLPLTAVQVFTDMAMMQLAQVVTRMVIGELQARGVVPPDDPGPLAQADDNADPDDEAHGFPVCGKV